MKKEIVFMFSGQGSQYYQMGKELYENNLRFKYWMDHCNDIVYPLINTSLIDIIYKKGQSKSEPFDRVIYTNPALVSIEYSLSCVLMEMSIQPDYLLGYSLGEITASVVSGVMTLEEGLQLVVGMAKLVEEETPLAEMLAIVEPQDIMNEYPHLFKNCWFTGKNFENNFVVSGLPNDIQYLEEGLRQKNSITQKLPVKYGFHTELIDSIEQEFKKLFQKINLSNMDIPIISSLTTNIINKVNENYYWSVIRDFVNFEQTINLTLKKGDYIFIDVGPGGSLATSVKYILPEDSGSLPLQTINQFGGDLNSLERMRNSLNEVVSN